MMSKKEFRKYLIGKPNKELLETLKNRAYYSRSDILGVRKEMERRKKAGLMRIVAGKKRRR